MAKIVEGMPKLKMTPRKAEGRPKQRQRHPKGRPGTPWGDPGETLGWPGATVPKTKPGNQFFRFKNGPDFRGPGKNFR